jgi:hypothetical protein
MGGPMRIYVFCVAVACSVLGASASAHAACGPITVCDYYKIPPVCVTRTVCTLVPGAEALRAPEGHGYSLELKGLSKNELEKLLGEVGADKSTINALTGK